jgi:hypothetical protein
MDTILADNRAAFTERLDALLALKADEAFAGSCDPATASDRRAVFRQARLDFIARFQPDAGSPPRVRKPCSHMQGNEPFSADDLEARIDKICGCAGQWDCNCVSVFNRAMSELWYEHNSKPRSS